MSLRANVVLARATATAVICGVMLLPGVVSWSASAAFAAATTSVATSPVAPVITRVATANSSVPTTRKTMYAAVKTNVRSGASTDFGIIRKLEKGQRVIVIGTKSGWNRDKGTTVNWCRLADGGWVPLYLLRKDAPLSMTGAIGFSRSR